jgi:Flp pilus assembly CpaF family ATPase
MNNVDVLKFTNQSWEGKYKDYKKSGIKFEDNKNVGETKLFEEVCQKAKQYVTNHINNDLKLNSDHKVILERQKGAIAGKKEERQYFTNLIEQYLIEDNKKNVKYPSYYNSLSEGIYNECWGFSKISNWLEDDTNQATDLIISCNEVFVKIKDKNEKLDFTLSDDEIDRIVKKLLSINAKKHNHKKEFQELFTIDGIRVTIFLNKGIEQKTRIIFRKQTVKNLTLENISDLGTFPKEAIPIIEYIIKLQTNKVFCGEMGSGKTTLLNTTLSLRDKLFKHLHCFLIQDDPEIDYKTIMPNTVVTPIILNFEDRKFLDIEKFALRSSADVFDFAEGRSEEMIKLFAQLLDRGTNGCSLTYHSGASSRVLDNMSLAFHESIRETMKYKLAQKLDFVFFMKKVGNGRKVLDNITQVYLDDNNEIKHHKIMEYNSIVKDGEIEEKFIFRFLDDKDKRESFIGEKLKIYEEYMSYLKSISEDENKILKKG